MSNYKYYMHRAVKWMRQYTFLLNCIIMLIGLGFVLFGILYFSPQNKTSAESICVGIGCSLIASGIVAFIVYPSLENKELVDFREIHDEKGLQTIVEAGNLLNASGNWTWPSRSLDLITDRIDDLNVILNEKSPIPNKLKIRIITKQPTLLEKTKAAKIRELDNWAKYNKNHVKIKYYGNTSMPYYCLQDYRITYGYLVDDSEEGQRYIYTYSAENEVGKKGQRYFDVLWDKPYDHNIADTILGRSSATQSECIEKVLEYFCRINKKRLNLERDIEAVVVIWTENKKIRRTFFSCNKTPDKGKHNMRAYGDGVVGLLQKVLDNDEKQTNGLLLYDYEKESINCEYITDIRTGESRNMRVTTQTWKDKSTKAMLAISLFRQTYEGPQMFGAITFDFAETLKDKEDELKKDLYSSVRDCRDILLPMLATNIVNDYETELINLQREESQITAEIGIRESLLIPGEENTSGDETEQKTEDNSSVEG